jgi:hypothetical protein
LIADRNAQACEGTVGCTAFAINNRCDVDCGIATSQAQAAPLARSLLAFSETQCRGCTMPEPCPPRLFEPRCVNGRCELVRP